MPRLVLCVALLGLLVPSGILIVTRLQGGVFQWPHLAVALWPTSIILMGIREMNSFGIAVFVIAILSNVALYGVIATLLRLTVGRLLR
jgi:hypothetical protein